MARSQAGEIRPKPWPAAALRTSAAAVLFSLLGLAVLAWLLTVRQSHADSMMMSVQPLLGRTDDMAVGMGDAASPMGLPLFLGMWVTMMVAMMFPSVAPMVVIYSRFSSVRGQTPWATPVFVGGYLLSWSLVGLLAFAAYQGGMSLTNSLSPHQSAVVGGAALAVAGAYQLTRLKTVCLRHCRTPLDFMLHWRGGLLGGLRMGVHHGLFCLGCCWGLMLVLLTVGLASLLWMALVATVIFVEKVLPFGWATAKAVGVVLIGVGIGVGSIPAAPQLFGG